MEILLLNPKDLKDVTVKDGVIDFKIKRKYGKFQREVYKLESTDTKTNKCNG